MDRAHAVLILLVEIVSICGEDVMSDVDASMLAAALQLCRPSQDPPRTRGFSEEECFLEGARGVRHRHFSHPNERASMLNLFKAGT